MLWIIKNVCAYRLIIISKNRNIVLLLQFVRGYVTIAV